MTNIELQSIISIGDICIIDGEERKFLGFEYCKWIEYVTDFDSCKRCKGQMIFDGLMAECHSTTDPGEHEHISDIEIIKKSYEPILADILSKELFEI